MNNDLRYKIKLTLDELLTQWPDVRFNQLRNGEAGYIIAHGSCDAYVKEALSRLEKYNIVSPEDITVIMWKSDRLLMHTCMLIHGKLYDSMFVHGLDYTRDNLNSLFMLHACEVKLWYDLASIIVENSTKKVIYNPWPNEGVIYDLCVEYRNDGRTFLNYPHDKFFKECV